MAPACTTGCPCCLSCCRCGHAACRCPGAALPCRSFPLSSLLDCYYLCRTGVGSCLQIDVGPLWAVAANWHKFGMAVHGGGTCAVRGAAEAGSGPACMRVPVLPMPRLRGSCCALALPLRPPGRALFFPDPPDTLTHSLTLPALQAKAHIVSASYGEARLRCMPRVYTLLYSALIDSQQPTAADVRVLCLAARWPAGSPPAQSRAFHACLI